MSQFLGGGIELAAAAAARTATAFALILALAFTLGIAALAENWALAADESTVNGKVSSSA